MRNLNEILTLGEVDDTSPFCCVAVLSHPLGNVASNNPQLPAIYVIASRYTGGWSLKKRGAGFSLPKGGCGER